MEINGARGDSATVREVVSMDATNDEGMNLQLSTSSVAGSAGAATNFQEESRFIHIYSPTKLSSAPSPISILKTLLTS